MDKIRILTPSRLHFSLIDLNGEIGRIDGGFGVGLNFPNFEIIIEKSDKGSIKIMNDNDDVVETYEEILNVIKILDEKFNTGNNYKILIKKAIPRHSGLGSTTQLRLGIASGILKLNDKSLNVYEIAKIVKRGGTSGIGIKVFESGGFVVDCGHSIKEKTSFLPSSASEAKPAKILLNYKFPDWFFVCAFPKSKKVYGMKEVDIFKKYCPIKREYVEKISHILLMKILPSILEKDIENFGDGLNLIQNLGFKRIEVMLSESEELIKDLQSKSYGAGLSSFGPCIYSLCENKKHASEVASFLNEKNIKNFITNANNSGAYFEY